VTRRAQKITGAEDKSTLSGVPFLTTVYLAVPKKRKNEKEEVQSKGAQGSGRLYKFSCQAISIYTELLLLQLSAPGD